MGRGQAALTHAQDQFSVVFGNRRGVYGAQEPAIAQAESISDTKKHPYLPFAEDKETAERRIALAVWLLETQHEKGFEEEHLWKAADTKTYFLPTEDTNWDDRHERRAEAHRDLDSLVDQGLCYGGNTLHLGGINQYKMIDPKKWPKKYQRVLAAWKKSGSPVKPLVTTNSPGS